MPMRRYQAEVVMWLRTMLAVWRSLRLAISLRPAVRFHIARLTAWEGRMTAFTDASALIGPRPTSSDCDSPAAFASAMLHWIEEQAAIPKPYPAPPAPIAIERSIEIVTGPDGSRLYVPVRDVWGHTVYRDHFIQHNKLHLDDSGGTPSAWTPVPIRDVPAWKTET
jgi:hypothetical protein